MIDDLVRLIKLGMITIENIMDVDIRIQVQAKLDEVI